MRTRHEDDDADYDERPVRRRYQCPDRMCGAEDCAHCHPEGQGGEDDSEE